MFRYDFCHSYSWFQISKIACTRPLYSSVFFNRRKFGKICGNGFAVMIVNNFAFLSIHIISLSESQKLSISSSGSDLRDSSVNDTYYSIHTNLIILEEISGMLSIYTTPNITSHFSFRERYYIFLLQTTQSFGSILRT